MRKLGVFTVILTTCLLGCDVASYSIVLTNATETKTVSYTYNGTSDTLGPLETRRYEVGAWTQPPVNVVDQNGIASVHVRTSGTTGNHTFVYIRPIILEVKNTLPVNATIRAGNFIDNGGLKELTVISGETTESTIFIYTENPSFTMTGNFPANFGVNIVTLICECEDDPENDFKCIRDNYELENIWGNAERRPLRKMYVTIR